jgi:opacity protein-like surface antigen
METMMRMKWMQAVLTAIAIAVVSGAAQAQASTAGQAQAKAAGQARENAASDSQFDIGASFYDALNNATSGNGTEQTPKNATGGMVEVRYIANPLFGAEMTYSYNTADQSFAPKTGNCGYACANPPTSLTAKASEVGLDYVVSKKIGSIRPFAVGGLGFFITSPAKSAYEVDTVVRPAFIYGGGLDWGFLSHLGVRVQFRDNVYKAPNLSALYPSTGVYTHTKEPMGGLYFRF